MRRLRYALLRDAVVVREGAHPSFLKTIVEHTAFPKQGGIETMVRQNVKDDAELIWVPGGTFRMGSDLEALRRLWQQNGWDADQLAKDGRIHSELSPHEVEIAGFWMYRDLVTIEQYFRFLQETGYPAPVDPQIHTEENSAWLDDCPRPGTLSLPVSSLSWEDAVAY